MYPYEIREITDKFLTLFEIFIIVFVIWIVLQVLHII